MGKTKGHPRGNWRVASVTTATILLGNQYCLRKSQMPYKTLEIRFRRLPRSVKSKISDFTTPMYSEIRSLSKNGLALICGKGKSGGIMSHDSAARLMRCASTETWALNIASGFRANPSAWTKDSQKSGPVSSSFGKIALHNRTLCRQLTRKIGGEHERPSP